MPSTSICPYCGADATSVDGKRLVCSSYRRALPTAAAKVVAQAGARPRAPARQGVSRGYRKLCGLCGADVTFAARRKLEDGTYRCETCDRPSTKSQAHRSSDQAPRPLCIQCGAELKSTEGRDTCEACARTQKRPIARDSKPAVEPVDTAPAGQGGSATRWIILGIGAAVLCIGIATWIILTPRWDETHLAEIISMRQAATQLYGANKSVEAYHAFQALFAFVGDHPIKNSYAVAELDGAKVTMAQAYAKAKTILDQEEADARAREAAAEAAARQQAADAAALKERQDRERAAQELAAQEQAKADQARIELAAKQAVAKALFARSAEHAALQSKAESIVAALRTELAGEDSAYRSISERARAARDLFAVLVKLQGQLSGSNVDDKVDQISAAVDRELIGEDSAIRATYINDRASLDLLGVWCSILSKNFPSLPAAFDKVQSEAVLAEAGDDSAIRAIDAYSAGILDALRLITSSICGAQGPDAVMSAIATAQIGEDSAWRSSMHNCDGSMKMLLLLLDHDGSDEAKRIRSEAFAEAVDDDSAVRVQSQYRQGIVDATAAMIQNR